MANLLKLPRYIINEYNQNIICNYKISNKYGLFISLYDKNALIDTYGSFDLSNDYYNKINDYMKILLSRNKINDNLTYHINFVNKPENIINNNYSFKKFNNLFILGIHGLIIEFDKDKLIYSASFLKKYFNNNINEFNFNEFITNLKKKFNIKNNFMKIDRFKCQEFKENDNFILEDNNYYNIYLPIFIYYLKYIALLNEA